MINTAFMEAFFDPLYDFTSQKSHWGLAQFLGALAGVARIVADLGGRALDFFAHALYLAGNCLYYCYASCASNPTRDTAKTADLISIHFDLLVKSTFGLVSAETIAGIVKAAFQGVLGPIFNPAKARVYAEDHRIYQNPENGLSDYCGPKVLNPKPVNPGA